MASDRDREPRRPWEEIKDLSGTGLLGITVPRSHGGPGVSARTIVEIFRIISAGDAAIGQIPQNHFVFVDVINRNAGAKAFAGDTAVQIASDAFELSGTSSTDDRFNLSRHWRNVRTHTLHDPARWKLHHIGNWVLNGVAPPNHGLL